MLLSPGRATSPPRFRNGWRSLEGIDAAAASADSVRHSGPRLLEPEASAVAFPDDSVQEIAFLERALAAIEQTAPGTWNRLAERLAVRAGGGGFPVTGSSAWRGGRSPPLPVLD